MKIRKLLFIYNPRSGRGTIQGMIPEILKCFDNAGYMTTIYKTRSPYDGEIVAAQEGEAYELVVCAGGDGTLNNIISGVMKIPEDKRPRVGFIPAGSTNDTRSSYSLPASIPHAAKIAVTGHPFRTDIGLANDRYFTYVASFGELSAVSCFTSQVAKNLFGRSAYITEGIKALLKMESHHIKVTWEEGTVAGEFFLGMITNALSVGGFQNITGGGVDLADGLFEVMLLKKPADLLEFNKEVEAVLLASLGREATGDGLVYKFKTSRAVFGSADDLQWVVDGENAGRHKITTITNLPGAVEIMSGRAIS